MIPSLTNRIYGVVIIMWNEYRPDDCAVVFKTKEEHGALSNMAAGFPLVVCGVSVRTAEALYQALRYPDMPEVQREIIDAASPMTAKMIGKPYRLQTRQDWDSIRLNLMEWCLRVKLIQNWTNFSEALLATGDKPIVELSRKDDFWGAKPTASGILVGANHLGLLLEKLRHEIKEGTIAELDTIRALEVDNFRLLGNLIGDISSKQKQDGINCEEDFQLVS